MKHRGQRSASNAMISSSLCKSMVGSSLNIFVLQKSRFEPAIYPSDYIVRSPYGAAITANSCPGTIIHVAPALLLMHAARPPRRPSRLGLGRRLASWHPRKKRRPPTAGDLTAVQLNSQIQKLAPPAAFFFPLLFGLSRQDFLPALPQRHHCQCDLHPSAPVNWFSSCRHALVAPNQCQSRPKRCARSCKRETAAGQLVP